MLTIDCTFKRLAETKSFFICLGDFLDEFYRSNDTDKQLSIENEPRDYHLPTHQRAFLASAVHKLANDFNLEVPAWVFKPIYYSKDKPYFDCNAVGNLRKLFLYKSPIEFKHRNVFVDENILKRV